MKSTLQAQFTIADIEGFIQRKVELANKAVLNAFMFAGETFVKEARSKTAAEGGFNDITGNLRSSIGYIILQDGKQLFSDFIESENGSDRATGVQIGLEVAQEIGSVYKKGLILICVAGMEYAAAVESKGKDVITGSSLLLQDQLKTLLSQI